MTGLLSLKKYQFVFCTQQITISYRHNEHSHNPARYHYRKQFSIIGIFSYRRTMKKTKNKIYKIIYNIHLFSCIKSFNKGRLIIYILEIISPCLKIKSAHNRIHSIFEILFFLIIVHHTCIIV